MNSTKDSAHADMESFGARLRLETARSLQLASELNELARKKAKCGTYSKSLKERSGRNESR